MKSFNLFARLLDRFIWMVGLMTIFIYAQDHWPTFYFVATGVLLGGFAIWYFWKFFLLPCRDGLRGR
jgi:hypothetical protein